MENCRAFTLIELLVVVLIIGILAAVALPQYQKAVHKSRVSMMFPILSNLIQSEEVYYVANGTYPLDVRLLDIDMPGECKLKNEETGDVWACGIDFMLKMTQAGEGVAAVLNYCPNSNNTSLENCVSNSLFSIGFVTHIAAGRRWAPNARRCWVGSDSTKGREDICKVLGTPVTCGDKTCYEIY